MSFTKHTTTVDWEGGVNDMTTHQLKILPEHFIPVLERLKTAELRNNDRNFSTGDKLLLLEWDGEYTGASCTRYVTHVADVNDYLPGYVLLSMVEHL